MTVVARAALAAMLGSCVAACGATDERSGSISPMPQPASTATVPNAPETMPTVIASPPIVGQIITGEPTETWLEAPVPGHVVLQSGCVRLQIDGVGLIVAVWPHGTRWEHQTSSIALDDGGVIEIGDLVDGGGRYYSASTLGEIMPTVLEPVLDCLPDGVSAETADQVVLAYPDRISAGPITARTMPPLPDQPTVIAAEPDASDSCFPVPVIELVSAAGRVTMDVIHYSEQRPPCGLDVDGDAVFDDEFRPAEALAVPDGALTIAPDQTGDVSVDVQPLEPSDRPAAATLSSDHLATASDGTYAITIAADGCAVITVGWASDQRSGTYVALAESVPRACRPS